MKLELLIKDIKPISILGDVTTEITGINIDSRQIEAGHLFIAVRGTQTDGHNYIGKAIEQGAKAVICETIPEDKPDHTTFIQVANSEEFIGKFAKTLYGNPT